MTTLTTFTAKGTALTKAEADANFSQTTQVKTGAYTVAEGDNRDTIEVTGTTTITLPDASTIAAAADTSDFQVTIKNTGTNTVTITCTTGTDTIDGSTADITLAPQETETLKVNQASNGYDRLNGIVKTAPDFVGTVDIDGNTDFDSSSTERRINFNTGTNTSYFYGSTNGDIGLFDFTNTRSIFSYDESANTFNFAITLAATSANLTTPVLTTSVSGTAIKDEDDMASDSASHLVTQQSVKAYVDTRVNSGQVNSAGTMVKQSASYTSARISTGNYRITHSIGDTNYTLLAVFYGTGANTTVSVTSEALNTVDIIIRTSGVAADGDFNWTLIQW